MNSQRLEGDHVETQGHLDSALLGKACIQLLLSYPACCANAASHTVSECTHDQDAVLFYLEDIHATNQPVIYLNKSASLRLGTWLFASAITHLKTDQTLQCSAREKIKSHLLEHHGKIVPYRAASLQIISQLTCKSTDGRS